MSKLSTMVEIRIPRPPNFLHVILGGVSIPISDLTDAQLREVGEAWTDALIKRAQEMRKDDAPRPLPSPRSAVHRNYGSTR